TADCTGSPLTNTVSVGADSTPYWRTTFGFTSMSRPTIFTLPAISVAISSSTGVTFLQGMHQSAQKSTRTGVSDWSTSAWNVASVTWLVSGTIFPLLSAAC